MASKRKSRWSACFALLPGLALASAAGAQSISASHCTNFSGMWLDADRPAQGLMLEQWDEAWVAPDGGPPRVGVSWFTWAPAGDPAPGPRWLFGIGRRTGTSIVVDPMILAVQGQFPRAPNTPPAHIEPWGPLTLRFEIDHSGAVAGSVDFKGPDGWGNGVRRLKQITAVNYGFNNLCVAFSPPPRNLFAPAGTYSAPAHVGQGWVLNQYARPDATAPFRYRVESALIGYTYDGSRRPAWMFGIDADAADGARFTMQRAISGGTFEGGEPLLQPWGEIRLARGHPAPVRRGDCVVETLSWSTDDAGAFGSGSLVLGQLTRPYDHSVGSVHCYPL
jgi:hypothetical protein